MGYDSERKLEWDDEKSNLLKEVRGFHLVEVAYEILSDRFGKYSHPNYPDQTRAVGLIGGVYYTLAFEEVVDELGSFIHLVTYWKSEEWEIGKAYEE